MDEKPILVLGGSGKTGRRVVQDLAARGAHPLAASRGSRRTFDWDEKSTWSPALAGVDGIYLVDSHDERAAALMSELLDMARHSGVSRAVMLSARAWEQSNDPSIFSAEEAVRTSGIDWTILRPTWFHQNFTEWPILSDAVESGEIRLPLEIGPEAFVDADDIAAVAGTVLTEQGHEGLVYGLSGPRTLTFEDCAKEIAEWTGRELKYVSVPEGSYVEYLTDRGCDEEYSWFTARLLGLMSGNASDYLSDGVTTVLGRDPKDFSAYVRSAFPRGK